MKHLLQKTIALKALLLVSMLIGAGSGAWAEDYVKVTSEADLVHGDHYILVAESANKALSSFNTSGTKYGIGTDVTIENETISTTKVMSFFLDGSKSEGWSLKSESLNQYLSWSSGNSLTTGSKEYKWTITFSGGNVLIVSQNDSSRKIRWNSGSPRFACYTTEQTDIQLYKLVEANVSPLASIAVDASVATTVFHVGDAFTHEGVVVTATYENESTKDVTTSATFSTPDMTNAGTKTVTISYTENEVEKTTSYTIEVKAAAALESITLSGTYPTEFTQGGVFSAEGIVVTANYDDETTKDVTEEASFSGYDMTATGTQTVTVGFGGKTATYTITVNAYTQPTEVTVNMNYEWLGSGNGSNLSSSQLPVVKEQDNITITITDGTSTRPRGDADYIRVYNGSTIKFEAPTGYNVTKIVFTTGGSGTWNAPTVDEGTLSEKTWTGEATEVTFSLNGSCFIASAKVSLDTAAPKVLSSIALSGEYPTTFHIGDAFSHEGMTVTATYESGKTVDVTAAASFSGYDMATAGTQTVTVSYTEGEVTKTATYNITVNAPAVLTSITLSGTYPTEFGQGDEFSSEGIEVTAHYDDDATSDVTGRATFSGYDMATLGEQTVTVTYEGKTATYIITIVEKKGTATNPYTVAEAFAAIDAGTGITNVYATGIISQVDSYNSTYSSITYWISSDGTTTSDQLQVYSGKGLNNTNFSSVNDVAVGATVVIYGTLKKYNSTYEFDKNNYLTSYTEPVVAVETPTFSPEPGVYTEAQTVTITCDTEGATIMYCFDGQEWQEYPENGILLSEYKTYIIHAKAEKGSDVSRYAEATYTINDPNAPGSANQPYTVAEAVAAVDAGTGITGVYVTGIISQVDSYQNSKYITYWISADGTTESQQFEVYKGLGIDGAAFSSKDDLQVGDEVVVKGNITLYNSSTYEFVVDNQLVSLKRKQTVTLSFEKPEYTATLDETFTAPTLTVTNAATGEAISGLTITYSYESFGNLPIELNLTTGEVTLKEPGEATVIATFAGNDDYKPATASYKLTVTSNKAATNLVIDQLTSTTLNVGDKIQLDYTTNGDGDITWKSSNENVLTVDQQGNVTAVAAGKATITITQSETEAYQAGEATIELTVVDPNQGEYLWLLAEASYSSASEDQVTWTSDYATMVLKKDKSQQNANSYLGGDENKRTSSRFYTDQILTITRVEGYRIASVLFQATTENYATTFKNSTWTNVAEPTLDSKSVILTPTDGMEPIVATIGGTCGFDKVQVIYVKTDEVVKKAANLAFAETTFNVEPEADFTAPELTTAEGFDGTVVYSSSDADIALVDETTGEVLIGDKEGVVTITATSAETDNFKAGSASYTITVKAPEKAEPEISFAEAIYAVNIGEEFTAPALINPHGLTVTYSCDNVEIALVDETTGDVVLDTQAKATVTITATFAGDETYKAGSASYTIKIVDPTEDEFDLTIASYETATVDKVVWDGGMASMVLAKSSSKTPANNYLGGDYDHTRVYKEQLLTITSEAKEIVSIQLLSNNSSADQLLIDNANYCATSESNSDLTYVAPEGFRATSVTFNISSAARLTKVVVTYADHTVPGTYVREELTAGNWGTICLPYDARVDGATLYTLAGIDDKDTPSKMYLSEAENLEAGKPYFFQATANTLTATYISGVASKAQSVNGLVGTLEAIIPDAEADPLEGMYLLSGGKIIKCGTGCSLAANRAYINMNQVSVYDGETAGVKVFNLGGEDGISSLDAASEGAVIYDLSGRRVSKTTKGLYIVNGKKVSVK